MLKSTPPAERVAAMLAAISTAAGALFKHTNKAITLRDKANRTTNTWGPYQLGEKYMIREVNCPAGKPAVRCGCSSNRIRIRKTDKNDMSSRMRKNDKRQNASTQISRS